jgi:hypothetical protein
MAAGTRLQEVQRQGRESDYLPSSSERSCAFTSHVFSWRGALLIKSRGNFALY